MVASCSIASSAATVTPALSPALPPAPLPAVQLPPAPLVLALCTSSSHNFLQAACWRQKVLLLLLLLPAIRIRKSPLLTAAVMAPASYTALRSAALPLALMSVRVA